MVGRASALLALVAALASWFELAPHLSPVALWPGVAIVACVMMPAFFAASWLALPLWHHRLVLLVGALVMLALAVGSAELLHAEVISNLAKFAALTMLGWLFLTLFEFLSWVVAVALIVPFVDAYSVWRGPTKSITTHHASVFSTLSIAFVVPGGGAARLGLPDVLFFSLFLAASVRFGLRPNLTWLLMLIGLGITMALTNVAGAAGLPALPAISLGFLAANGDLIWRNATQRRRAQAPAPVSDG